MVGKSAVQWGAQSARAALFPTDFETRSARELYLTAFEHEPSSFQSAPHSAPHAPSTASGFHNIGSPTLQKSPGRIDLVISPSQPQKPTIGKIVTLQDTDGAFILLQNAVENISKSFKNFARMAMIVDLVTSARDSDDANRQISEILPILIDLNETSDFNLQLSKRRQSETFPEVKYNVVHRWYVAQVHQLTFQGSPGISAIPSPVMFYMAGYTLDVNTVPEITHIDAVRSTSIFKELRGLLDMARRSETLG